MYIRKDEVGIAINGVSKNIELEKIFKLRKSVCKISYNIYFQKKKKYGTGFFMILFPYNPFRCLVTNYHVVSEELKDIELELQNKKNIKLSLDKNARFTAFFKSPIDITIIEIKDQDLNIINNIDFLNLDENYRYGYNLYENKEVFSLGFPHGVAMFQGTGKITYINNYEFNHYLSTYEGSSGSPICLNNDSSDSKVIGIHKQGDLGNNINIGTFIGVILDKLNSIRQNRKMFDKRNNDSKLFENILLISGSTKKRINNNSPNYLHDYRQDKKNINYFNVNFSREKIENKIPIDFSPNLYRINKNIYNNLNESNNYFNDYNDDLVPRKYNNYIPKKENIFDNSISTNYIEGEILIHKNDLNEEIRIIYSNSKEVGKKCEISIDNKKIKFSSYYKFNCIGRHKIKYSFNNLLSNTSNMFQDCSSLSYLDLSNFNAANVINMKGMFSNCISLSNLNLTKINTENVSDMSEMFRGCSSLKNLNLSDFNTEKVIYMNEMFRDCSSLINVKLSNFNTENVTDMCEMFRGCSSISNLNLSNFKTANVKNMCEMFRGCSSLQNLNLSNFNTSNVRNMSEMFRSCSSLLNLNLSNFNTANVIDMNYMFQDCSSLSNLNLSNFNTSKVKNIDWMFLNCSSNLIIITKDFKIKQYGFNHKIPK